MSKSKPSPSQGKGDKNRSTKKYQENYDNIEWKPKITMKQINDLFEGLRKIKFL